MGSAEYCFVTIMQRVTGFLRVRLHYGHPDYFDGYWVRTRGGVSKASHLINTSEDIFSGYEVIGRGEKIKYIEYVEQEKGRESAFDSAFIFEAKLAKGAAQQIKTPHVYMLNEKLPLIARLSLFFGSLGFYVCTMLMSISIDLYIFTILLYISSGVDYHALGLLDAVIAVPWILQLGYIQALPLLLELSIEQGIWEGVAMFLRRLLIGVVFFIFHVRTKSFYFAQGLLSGKGGYMATGRGYGLDRRSFLDLYKLYFDSHFNNALILFVASMAYCIASTDKSSEIALRLFSIFLVVFSWLVAPVMFNPYPTREAHQNDFDQMLDWIRCPVNLKPEATLLKKIAEAESEVSRKKVITDWWTPKESASYTAYFAKNIIEEWQAEDHLFKGRLDRIMLFIQKFIFFMWRTLPWVLLCIPMYSYESLYYLFYLMACIAIVFYIDKRHGDRHEHFTTVKVAMLLILAPLITVLVNGKMTVDSLLVSFVLYLVLFYAFFQDFALGFYNNALIKRMRAVEGSALFPQRAKIPMFFYRLFAFWPTMTLLFLSIINAVCILLSNLLTSLLYNGVVTDRWNRAYMTMKMQFIDKTAFLQAAKDVARLSSMPGSFSTDNLSEMSSSSSARERTSTIMDEDMFAIGEKIQTEMHDVRSEVSDQVDLIDQKISIMRDMMTKNMETIRKHIMSMPAGGGGGPGHVNFSGLSLGYDDIKSQIEDKTKMMMDMTAPEKDRNAANIELEKLFVMLETCPEFKAEEAAKAEEKKRINEPIDKKALDEMRAKYSEASLSVHPDIFARWTAATSLKLLMMEKSEIVKKHANDWKFITINELTTQEMRAIRSNLPNFGRNQVRQLAWVKSLDDRIDRVESGLEKVQAIPKAAAASLAGGAGAPPPPPPLVKLRVSLQSTANRTANPAGLFDQIKNGDFGLKKKGVVFMDPPEQEPPK